VTTRFTRPMRTIAVALTGAAPRNLDATQVHLVGARLAADDAGREKAPVVVSLGATTVLVYEVVPDQAASQLTVVTTPGSDWVVSGVLGAPGRSPAEVGELLAHKGLAGVTAQLTVMSGPGCSADWVPAEAPAPVPAARPRRQTRKTGRSRR
jgi:large repetitive protein